jgi:hypothetical protein
MMRTPATSVCAEKRPMRMRSRESPTTVRNPTIVPEKMLERVDSTGTPRLPQDRDGLMKYAENRNPIAVMRKIDHALTTASSSPAIAGPMKKPRL